MIKPLDIGIVKGKWLNLLDALVMWRSLSSYSHCFIFQDRYGSIFDPTMVPNTLDNGVLSRDIRVYSDRKIKIVRYRNKLNIVKLLNWCYERQACCKGYDFKAWLGFATGIKKFQDDDRYYCSEFPYKMFMENGVRITEEEQDFVFPSQFARNPLFMTVYEGKASELIKEMNNEDN